MKLYRVLPDAYSISGKKIETKRYPGNDLFFEAIYNNGGYTSLELSINSGQGGNSIGKDLKEPSKYLYLFPEDAIKCANMILPSNKFARIVVYDIPEDIALQNVGLGNYRGKVVIETAVGVSNFTGERSKYRDLEDKHEELILAHLKDTMDIYRYHFDKTFSMSDEEIINIFNTDYRINILDYDCNSVLTKSDFLTGNIYPFINSHSSFEEMQKMNVEYLKDKGLTLDYSKDACEERESLLANLNSLPNLYYDSISSFRDNDVVRDRVKTYIKNR